MIKGRELSFSRQNLSGCKRFGDIRGSLIISCRLNGGRVSIAFCDEMAKSLTVSKDKSD